MVVLLNISHRASRAGAEVLSQPRAWGNLTTDILSFQNEKIQ